MPLVHQDEETILQILGANEVPPEIEEEYMIRIRMLHRFTAGGPLGIVGIIDMIRSMQMGPPPPQAVDENGNTNWRRLEVGTAVLVSGRGEGAFQGEVEAGTLAIEIDGHIDEFPAHMVQEPKSRLPSDVDERSIADKPSVDPDDVPDRRLDLITEEEARAPEQLDEELVSDPTEEDLLTEEQNEVEANTPVGDIGSDDEPDINRVQPKHNWGHVRKGTAVWYYGPDNVEDAVFQRCGKQGKAFIVIDGETEQREVDRRYLRIPG